jgi:hypothetical protein
VGLLLLLFVLEAVPGPEEDGWSVGEISGGGSQAGVLDEVLVVVVACSSSLFLRFRLSESSCGGSSSASSVRVLKN